MFISYLSGFKKSKETVIFVALKVQFQSLSSINRTYVFLGFPCGSAGKESACNVEDLGLIPGLGRSPGEGKGPTPVFWLGELHGLYSPWVCKWLDKTEQLLLSLSSEHIHTHLVM